MSRLPVQMGASVHSRAHGGSPSLEESFPKRGSAMAAPAFAALLKDRMGMVSNAFRVDGRPGPA